ncbi:hypothetical protein TorRG33x02_093540 [Trema orientale]|uniref:Uncharacterized protein n=1 Tax=Trema orientale TaxID=63057 RepID=A0A2P5FAN1_TREOI|nr:hypothetical protein TorRG33x02_093540 [Trema orientale]
MDTLDSVLPRLGCQLTHVVSNERF